MAGSRRNTQPPITPYTLDIFDQLRGKRADIGESMETVALDCETPLDNWNISSLNGFFSSHEQYAVEAVRLWCLGTRLVSGTVRWSRMTVYDQTFPEGQVDGLVLSETDDQQVIFVIVVSHCIRNQYALARSQLYDFIALRNALIASNGEGLCFKAAEFFNLLKLNETARIHCRPTIHGTEVSLFNREQARLDNIFLFERDDPTLDSHNSCNSVIR